MLQATKQFVCIMHDRRHLNHINMCMYKWYIYKSNALLFQKGPFTDQIQTISKS